MLVRKEEQAKSGFRISKTRVHSEDVSWREQLRSVDLGMQ